ncbi:MAG: YfhO family protein [Bacilli bacterium]|jgi:putative flippase GtrA/uncharacterized membrane protein YfhO|nr:YfhO family protein [Bacilli bacterium]
MRQVLIKNKNIIIETLIFLGCCLAFMGLMSLIHASIGRSYGDFTEQHVRFIDYLRHNFKVTHDLFPQLSMNYGGGQNFANLYYHGMYNPLIMISYLFPFISTFHWLKIMQIIIVVSTFLGMNILLRKYYIKREYVIVISILGALSPSLLNHLGLHLMFTYYYPLFIFSLISILNIIKYHTKWHFIILIALIFYTNFFFALIIGLIQMIFLIGNIYFREKLNKKERIIIFKKIITSYLIGIMMGMMVFIPQALALFNGDRVDKIIPHLHLIHRNFLSSLTSDTNSIGLGMIGLFVLLTTIINYKNKFTLFLGTSSLLILICEYFNYLFNLFQYTHNKIYIFLVPIILLLLGLILDDKTIKKKHLLIISSCLLTLVIFHFQKGLYQKRFTAYDFQIAVILQTILLLILIRPDFQKRKLVVSSILVSCAFFTCAYSISFITNKNYDKYTITKRHHINSFIDKNKINDFHYTNTTSNKIRAINNYAPTMYASSMNNNFIKFYNEFILTEPSLFNRWIKDNMVDNYLVSNFLGIDEYYSRDNHYQMPTSRPFIYGVSHHNTYNLDNLKDYDKFDTLVALNQAFFTKDSNNKFKYQKLPIYDVVQSNKLIKDSDTEKFTIDIPKQYQKKGLFIIETKAINKPLTRSSWLINNHRIYFRGVNAYQEKAVRNGIIIINSNEKMTKLKVEVKGTSNIYNGYKIKFIDYDDIQKIQMPTIASTNNHVKYNHSYSFTLNMKDDGYLGTSIFDDKGFTIKDNGQVINKEVVNKYFLGAKLNKGVHHLVIEYHIPGFKLGVGISIIGLFFLGFIMIDEIKVLNRSFFRFVIVGAFNTINYFIAYTLLLMLFPYLLAHGIAFIYSAFVSYFITSIYTFKTKPNLKTFIAFPLTFLPNLIMSSIGTLALIEWHILNKSVASLVVMLLLIPVTYLINLLIFRKNINK